MCEKCPADAKERYAREYRPFKEWPTVTKRRASAIVGNPFGIRPLQNKRDHYETNGPGTKVGGQVVYWRLNNWHCEHCGGHPNALHPCLHIGAVLLHLGIVPDNVNRVELPEERRNQAALDQSKTHMETDFPRLAKQLVEAVLPDVLQNVRGRPRTEARTMMMGAIAYVESGRCLRETRSRLELWHQLGLIESIPGYGRLSKFLSSDACRFWSDRLMLVIAMTCKHFTFSGGPDGTGFQRRSFYAYAEKRREQQREKRLRATQKKRDEASKAAGQPEAETKKVGKDAPRRRGYYLAVPLIMYETNMVPAVAVRLYPGFDESDEDRQKRLSNSDGFPDAEAPYFLGLLELVRPFFPAIKQVRGDLGYWKFVHWLWGEIFHIDVQIPEKADFDEKSYLTGAPGKSAAMKAIAAYRRDIPAHLAAYHKRSHQEGCQNGIKVEMGPGVRLRSLLGQMNEVRLKYVCWNLKQLNYERYNRAIQPGQPWEPDFKGEAKIAAEADPPEVELMAKLYEDDPAHILRHQGPGYAAYDLARKLRK